MATSNRTPEIRAKSAPENLIYHPTFDRPSGSSAVAEEVGMNWWNHLTRLERLAALNAAETTMPAQAWEFWRLQQARPAAFVVDNVRMEVSHV